ncbi:MAG: PAS domain-containing sensor histidine kinase [Vicinamibacterales bacterium]
MRFDRRILLLALGSGLPASVAAVVLLWIGGYSPLLFWTLTTLVVGAWIGLAVTVRDRVVSPLRTLANLLAALRESDFSVRARRASPTGNDPQDPLGAVLREVNDLATTLHDERLGALEAGALLRTVMVEIDVVVFTFDAAGQLRLVNRAGERLLDRTAERLLGAPAADLGLARFLDGTTPRIEDASFPGGSARWEVRRTTFRQEGRPHHLLVLADVSRPLRDEERQAWQRLIRVIGHEINNSLAPIKSIAGSLESMLARDAAGGAELDDDTRRDMSKGLAIIAARSDSLSRFTTAYARLAKLPAPRLAPVRIDDLVRRAAGVETRLSVAIEPGPEITLRADPDQMEQLLINIVRNAADAAAETSGAVEIGWSLQGPMVVVRVDDEGPGLPTESNLFVPFFTTKPGGSGIGLVLSRQIAEAHGGSLTLENRSERMGCRALVRLPLRH